MLNSGVCGTYGAARRHEPPPATGASFNGGKEAIGNGATLKTKLVATFSYVNIFMWTVPAHENIDFAAKTMLVKLGSLSHVASKSDESCLWNPIS